MRLFIAIPLPADVRGSVLETQRALRAFGASGRFVPDNCFHITLHFIGESDQFIDIIEAMKLASRSVRPFPLHLAEYGRFSGNRVAFLSVVCDNKELYRLHKSLEHELYERGLLQARGRLTPHITLARNICGDEGFVWKKQKTTFCVDEFVLYESRRTDGSMRYIARHKEKLSCVPA